jgi:hypothetical protein
MDVQNVDYHSCSISMLPYLLLIRVEWIQSRIQVRRPLLQLNAIHCRQILLAINPTKFNIEYVSKCELGSLVGGTRQLGFRDIQLNPSNASEISLISLV